MSPAAEKLCKHCSQPLGALAVHLGRSRCERSMCRTQADLEDLDLRWKRVGSAACHAAAEQLGGAVEVPVLLQLEAGSRALVPVTDADHAFLVSRWRHAWHHQLSLPVDGADSLTDTPPEAAALCGHCAGRCCAHGGTQAAFIDATVLGRWQAEHPGTTVDDAMADYLSRLPAEHVEGQCCYQTSTGCSLPRERRADICNHYRCEALSTLAALVRAAPDAPAVVITRDERRLSAVVIMRQGRPTPLVGVPGPDDLRP